MGKAKHIQEPARTLPVVGEYDVLVAGGGMAGVAAALAAARRGAQVCLLERTFALGGLATLGNVVIWLPLCDGKGRQVIGGLGEELLRLSVADLQADAPKARFASVPECWSPGGDPEARGQHRFQAEFNPAAYLLALEAAVVDAGVRLLYDTRVCSVQREGARLSHVIVENKGGRAALACQTVVDATGDGDICFAAGEATESLASNVLAGWFYTLAAGTLQLHPLSQRYSPAAEREDAEGPFFRGDDPQEVTEHVLQTRALVRRRLVELRAAAEGVDVQPVMPATLACFRMTRRLVGAFSLGAAHAHTWFEDAIGLTGDWRRPGPVYAIPLRCLQAVKTANLLAAGRCISADTSAWDALRAIPPCVVTGQAAGTAAALAVEETGGDTQRLDGAVLAKALQQQGVLLDPELVAPLPEEPT